MCKERGGKVLEDLLVYGEDGPTIIASVHLMCYKDHMTVT